MEILLSIVIPVYKVVEYVGQTIDSIVQQKDFVNQLEIVFVDDGTPDDSMSVVRSHISSLTNVKIITQKNSGLSVARNNGFKATKGKYVWFVDSDDYLLPNALQDVYDCINAHPDADVFASLFEVHDESGHRHTFNEKQPLFNVATGFDYLKAKCPHGAIQRFVFKRYFLVDNNLFFYPGLLHEDDLFGFRMLYYAQKVCVLPRPVYAYRINRGGSIMNTISIRTPQSLLFIHKELKRFMMTEVKPEYREDYQLCIYNEIRNFFRFCIDILDKKEFIDYYKENSTYIKQESMFLLKRRRTFFLGIRMICFPRIPLLAYRYARDVYHQIKTC